MHRLGKELTTIRVQWLPLRVTNDDLSQWVSLYSDNVHSIVNEVSVAPNAAGLLTGDTEILANDGNTYHILISVDGRRPKCLKCGRIGHIRKKCKAVKCPVCRKWTEEHDGSTCPRRVRKQTARAIPMEPYGSQGQQTTGLSSSQMASAMEEEWTPVTNKKNRRAAQGSPAAPSSPQRPHRMEKTAKVAKTASQSGPSSSKPRPNQHSRILHLHLPRSHFRITMIKLSSLV